MYNECTKSVNVKIQNENCPKKTFLRNLRHFFAYSQVNANQRFSKVTSGKFTVKCDSFSDTTRFQRPVQR